MARWQILAQWDARKPVNGPFHGALKAKAHLFADTWERMGLEKGRKPTFMGHARLEMKQGCGGGLRRPHLLKIDPAFGFDSGLKGMFDLAHFADKVGIVHEFLFRVTARENDTGAG